jgi:hypothetical protein
LDIPVATVREINKIGLTKRQVDKVLAVIESVLAAIEPRPTRGKQIDPNWMPSPMLVDYGRRKFGFSTDRIFSIGETMVDWALGKGATKKDWAATFRNFMRSEYKKRQAQGERRVGFLKVVENGSARSGEAELFDSRGRPV